MTDSERGCSGPEGGYGPAPRISKPQPGAVLAFRLGNSLSPAGVCIGMGTPRLRRHLVTVDTAKKRRRGARPRLV